MFSATPPYSGADAGGGLGRNKSGDWYRFFQSIKAEISQLPRLVVLLTTNRLGICFTASSSGFVTVAVI